MPAFPPGGYGSSPARASPFTDRDPSDIDHLWPTTRSQSGVKRSGVRGIGVRASGAGIGITRLMNVWPSGSVGGANGRKQPPRIPTPRRKPIVTATDRPTTDSRSSGSGTSDRPDWRTASRIQPAATGMLDSTETTARASDRKHGAHFSSRVGVLRLFFGRPLERSIGWPAKDAAAACSPDFTPLHATHDSGPDFFLAARGRTTTLTGTRP